jgi:hypothetical protein
MPGQIATVRAGLVAALQGITAINAVYDFPQDQFSGYPAVVVNSAGYTNDFSDTSRNRLTYKFELYLFQGINRATNEQVARKRMDDLLDTLTATFNSQTHFAGSLLTKPIEADAPTLVDRPTPMVMSKMTIEMMYLTPR